MKDSVKDAVPATFPDCDLNPVMPVDLPPVPEPEFPECTTVSCPCVLVVSPQPVSNVITDLAKSWKAETREVNREELAEDFMFERLLNDLTGVTHCLMFPLTSTFNEECREELSPGIYGRKDVPSEVKARIRSENLFAIQMASLANKVCQTNKPWLIAVPAEINPSVFRLPEFPATFSHTGVTATRLDFAATGYDNTTLLGQCLLLVPGFRVRPGSTGHCPQAKTICAQAGRLRIMGDGSAHFCLCFSSIQKVSLLALPHQMHHATSSQKTHRFYGSPHSSEVINQMRRICVLSKISGPCLDSGTPQKSSRDFPGTLSWDRYWLACSEKLSLNARAFVR